MNIKKNLTVLSLAVVLIFVGLIKPAHSALYSDKQLGVRASGMGGAFVSVARNADAVYWNQASLALNKKRDLLLMYSDVYGLGIDESYASFSMPYEPEKIGFGASWYRTSANLEEGFGSTLKKNDWIDDVFVLGSGMKVSDNLYAGLGLKRFKIKTDITGSGDVGTSGTGLDFSLLYKKADFASIPAIDFGFQIRNFMTDLSGENVDPSYKLGASCNPLDELLVALEFDYDKDTLDGDYSTKYFLGAEYEVSKEFAVRMGANDGDFSIGFGVTLQDRITLDYAFEKGLGDLNKDNHRFSFNMTF